MTPIGVQVVVVEPGAVQTKIAARAIATANEVASHMTPEQSQRYGRLVQAITAQAASATESGLSADAAAQVIARAVTARKPRTRYTIGREAALLPLLATLPDRMLDRTRSNSFPVNGAFRRTVGLLHRCQIAARESKSRGSDLISSLWWLRVVSLCFWVAGRSPDVLLQRTKEIADGIRESDGSRRRSIRLGGRSSAMMLTDAGRSTGLSSLSFPRLRAAKLCRELTKWPGVSRAGRGALPGTRA
jgi:hypothetical protein